MSLIGGAGALAVALVLLASGAAHLCDRAGLRSALVAHGVLPHGLRRVVAAVLGIAAENPVPVLMLAIELGAPPVRQSFNRRLSYSGFIADIGDCAHTLPANGSIDAR